MEIRATTLSLRFPAVKEKMRQNNACLDVAEKLRTCDRFVQHAFLGLSEAKPFKRIEASGSQVGGNGLLNSLS